MIKFFTAEWCTSCQVMKKTLSEELASLTIVDADNEPDLVIEAGIRSIPTFIKYEEGVEVSRKIGSMTRADFLAWADE